MNRGPASPPLSPATSAPQRALEHPRFEQSFAIARGPKRAPPAELVSDADGPAAPHPHSQEDAFALPAPSRTPSGPKPGPPVVSDE